jgi:hypothetical protein
MPSTIVASELHTKSRYNLSDLPFSAAKAAEWFFIAALSAAMKKDILLSVLCVWLAPAVICGDKRAVIFNSPTHKAKLGPSRFAGRFNGAN